MKRMVILTLILLTSSPLSAARIFRVRVSMSSADIGINDKVQSYVRRELRSLADVSVVEDNPDFQIALTSHRYDGRETVYGLGALIQNMHTKRVALWVVYATPEKFLRQECDEIVVGFDRYVLEPARKSTVP